MKITEIDLTYTSKTLPDIHNPHQIHQLQNKISYALHRIYDYDPEITTYCLHLKYLQLDFVLRVFHELHQINTSLVHYYPENTVPQAVRSVHILLNDLRDEEAIGFFLRQVATHPFTHVRITKISVINSTREKDYVCYAENFLRQGIEVTFFVDEAAYRAAVASVQPDLSVQSPHNNLADAEVVTSLLPRCGMFSQAQVREKRDLAIAPVNFSVAVISMGPET